MKAWSKKGIRCARIVALALFCVSAITVATLPLWKERLPSSRAGKVTVDPFCEINLATKFGQADYFLVTGPDGEQTYAPNELASFCASGEYLVRAVTTQSEGVRVQKHTLTVREDKLAPTASIACSLPHVPLGAGFFVTATARDNFTPSSLLTCSLSAQNATVTERDGGYLVFPHAVGAVTLTFTAQDYAHNTATQTLTLTAMAQTQSLAILTSGTVAFDASTIFLVGLARASLVPAMTVGTYDLSFTGGTVTVWTATNQALCYTQKRLLVEVTEQGAFVNGDWVNGKVYLSFEGEDVCLTSSKPLI